MIRQERCDGKLGKTAKKFEENQRNSTKIEESAEEN